MSALDAIRSNPIGFSEDVLGFTPWSKQRSILESVRDHRRTAVRSAHGVGKTRTAAAAVLWYLAAHPGSTVVTTAPTWAQVREQLWREVGALIHHADGFYDGSLSETRLDLGRDWFAIGLSTDRPERFAGYHGANLLLVVDEASGVDQRVWDSAETFLTSAGAKVLAIGNPTSGSGTFFDSFHKDRALWNTIAISAYDSPNLTGERVTDAAARALVGREWVENAAARWGEASPLYAVRVLGEFPRMADDTVMPLADVEAAVRRVEEPGTPIVVAADIARFGSDETVIAVRRGQVVRIAHTSRGADLMRTAGEIIRVARAEYNRWKIRPKVVVDDAGLGGGVVDRLRELGEFQVVPFLGGSASRHAKEYPNRRSESWFVFADHLPTLDLADDEQLVADLVAPRYTIDSRGRRVVEAKSDTKRRLGRSPDRADAVLMAFADRAAASTAGPYIGRFSDLDNVRNDNERAAYGVATAIRLGESM